MAVVVRRDAAAVRPRRQHGATAAAHRDRQRLHRAVIRALQNAPELRVQVKALHGSPVPGEAFPEAWQAIDARSTMVVWLTRDSTRMPRQ